MITLQINLDYIHIALFRYGLVIVLMPKTGKWFGAWYIVRHTHHHHLVHSKLIKYFRLIFPLKSTYNRRTYL